MGAATLQEPDCLSADLGFPVPAVPRIVDELHHSKPVEPAEEAFAERWVSRGVGADFAQRLVEILLPEKPAHRFRKRTTMFQGWRVAEARNQRQLVEQNFQVKKGLQRVGGA